MPVNVRSLLQPGEVNPLEAEEGLYAVPVPNTGGTHSCVGCVWYLRAHPVTELCGKCLPEDRQDGCHVIFKRIEPNDP